MLTRGQWGERLVVMVTGVWEYVSLTRNPLGAWSRDDRWFSGLTVELC